MTGRKKTGGRKKSTGRTKSAGRTKSKGTTTSKKQTKKSSIDAMRVMMKRETEELAFLMQDDNLVGKIMSLYDSGKYREAATALDGYAESTMDDSVISDVKTVTSQLQHRASSIPATMWNGDSHEVLANTPATGGGWAAPFNMGRESQIEVGGNLYETKISLNDRLAVLNLRLKDRLQYEDWKSKMTMDVERVDPNGRYVDLAFTVPIRASDSGIRSALGATFLKLSPDKTFGHTYPLGQKQPEWMDIPDRDTTKGIKTVRFRVHNNLERSYV
jgi:hypothetical protein